MTRPIVRAKAKPAGLKPLAKLFRALADESRLFILALLSDRGEMSVSAIGKELGQSQPAVSHHLTQLRTARLIDYRREGKFNFYRVDESGLQATFEELTAESGGKLSLAGLEIVVRKK